MSSAPVSSLRSDGSTDRALRDAEARFRTFFDNAPIGKAMTRPDGTLDRVNPALCRMLGYTAEELSGISFAGITHPDDLEKSRECIRLLRARVQETCELEKRYLAKDGRVVWTHVTTRLLHDEDGVPQYFVTHVMDISKRKKLEEALVESERRYRVLFECLLDGYAYCRMVSEEGRPADFVCLHVNPVFARLTGLRDVVGKRVTELFPDVREDMPGIFEPLTRVATTGQPERFEVRSQRLGLWLEIAASCPAPGDFVAVFRDISSRKEAAAKLETASRELERSNVELERFAYIASHDLQEPLRMVASFTQLLSQRYADKLDSDAKEFIAFANDGARRMQRLIQDLLAYSRVTTQGRPFTQSDAGAALALALRNLGSSIEESEARITWDPLPVVLADEPQLVQVFQNLVGNAIKFHRDGVPPCVHVAVAPAPHDPGLWTFRISDNGIGIEEKHLAKLFVIFQRLHTREAYAGTGIGLAICKRIVERHGGEIRIESTPGTGTTFHFTLPAASAGERSRS